MFECELDGKKYVWNGKMWYEDEKYMELPVTITNKLRALMNPVDPAEVRYKTLSNEEMIKEACALIDSGDREKALEMIRFVLKNNPTDEKAISLLCVVLKAGGKPELVVDETSKFIRSSKLPALFAMRAAALCDLERWEEAKKEAARALVLGKKEYKEEVFSIVSRIKAKKPELYKN
jgi:hypothetical protein